MSGEEWFSTELAKGLSRVYNNSHVRTLVDAEEYYADLRKEVEATGSEGQICWIGFEGGGGDTPMPRSVVSKEVKAFPPRSKEEPPPESDKTWLELLTAASDERDVAIRALLNLHPSPDLKAGAPKKYKTANFDLVEKLNALRNCLAINDFRYLLMNGTQHQKLVVVYNPNSLIAYVGTCDVEKQRLLENNFMENVRKRIKDASNTKARPSWDLGEGERTIIYRNLIAQLMLDSWGITRTKPKEGGDSARLSHVRSELIRAIFDIDAMLYFVAPEWWMPRKHKRRYSGSADFRLTAHDVVKWDDLEKPEDNYKITEESSPAKLGSSLGWLLQLDGDNLRNAFLNAPWVKAVIPIRPGRENAALNWLHAIAGFEKDGWDSTYVATNAEDSKLVAQLAAEGKLSTIGNILTKIADRLEKDNGDIQNVLEADRVFEHGFDHLAGAFDASIDTTKPFSQWISVLPTDQLVAVEYKATDFLDP